MRTLSGYHGCKKVCARMGSGRSPQKKMATYLRCVQPILSVCLVGVVFVVAGCEPLSFSWSTANDGVALIWRERMGSSDYLFLGIIEHMRQDFPHVGQPQVLDVAEPGAFFSGVAWSPDGQYIAYYKFSSVGRTSKILESATDQNSLKLEGSPHAAHSRYEAALYSVCVETQNRILLAQFDWPAQGFCEESICRDLKPSWLPHAKRVLFVRKLSECRYRIESVDLTGRHRRRHYELSSIVTPRICVNGTRIGSIIGKNIRVYNMETESSTSFCLERFEQPTGLVWAADCSCVAYQADHTISFLDLNSGTSKVFADADTTEIKSLQLSFKGKKAYYLAKSAICVDRDAFGVWLLDAKTMEKHLLFSVDKAREPTKLGVSPDGQFVALWGASHAGEQHAESFLLLRNLKKDQHLTVDLGPL